MYLFSKYGKNGSGSVTVLKPRGEWMYKKILLGSHSLFTERVRSEWSVRERVFLGIYQTDVDDRRSKDGEHEKKT